MTILVDAPGAVELFYPITLEGNFKQLAIGYGSFGKNTLKILHGPFVE